MSNQILRRCVVVTCFDKNQPGFLDFSYRIQSLAKKYRLTIISQEKLTQPELMVEQAEYKILNGGENKLGWLSYLVKCAQFIRHHRFDGAVLLHTAAAPIGLMVGSIPTCLYWNEHPTNLMHLPTKFAPIRQLMTKALHQLIFFSAGKATLIMPVGEDHQDDLFLHEINPKKIKMLYMGVSDDFATDFKVQNQALKKAVHLMYVGTVSKDRGRDVMLESIALLVKRNIHVHLTIIGANEEQLDFCKKRIYALEITSFVSVLGRVPGNQIPQLLKQADAGICLWEPNLWNEFNPPTKLFEYLVAGIPVLASNIRTHTRYVKDWHNGLIFNYDAVSLANIIEELHKHQDKLPTLKNSARQSGERYLWSSIEPVFLAEMSNLMPSKSINRNSEAMLP